MFSHTSLVIYMIAKNRTFQSIQKQLVKLNNHIKKQRNCDQRYCALYKKLCVLIIDLNFILIVALINKNYKITIKFVKINNNFNLVKNFY